MILLFNHTLDLILTGQLPGVSLNVNSPTHCHFAEFYFAKCQFAECLIDEMVISVRKMPFGEMAFGEMTFSDSSGH